MDKFIDRRPTASEPEQPQGMRVDGMQQVVDMLLAADREFRESLLRRMSAQDPQLVGRLRRRLAEYGVR